MPMRRFFRGWLDSLLRGTLVFGLWWGWRGRKGRLGACVLLARPLGPLSLVCVCSFLCCVYSVYKGRGVLTTSSPSRC